jgi:hypothetical protein
VSLRSYPVLCPVLKLSLELDTPLSGWSIGGWSRLFQSIPQSLSINKITPDSWWATVAMRASSPSSLSMSLASTISSARSKHKTSRFVSQAVIQFLLRARCTSSSRSCQRFAHSYWKPSAS